MTLDGSSSFDPTEGCPGSSSLLHRWFCATQHSESCWRNEEFASTDAFSSDDIATINATVLISGQVLVFTHEIRATEVEGRSGDEISTTAAVDPLKGE